MMSTILTRLALGAVIAALAVLVVTSGSLLAQSATPSHGGMMEMTPAVTSQPPAGNASGTMGQMMTDCPGMMDMMSGMMQGGMMQGGMMDSNMMNGNGMMNMMGGDMMASPAAGMDHQATPSP